MKPYQLYNMDCLDFFKVEDDRRWDTIFADPPDNIGLKYDNYDDNLPKDDYIHLLHRWLRLFVQRSRCVWFSYNVKWWAQVGRIVTELEKHYGKRIEVKPCVQIYTFGQHNHNDLGNNHRLLLRIRWIGSPLHPDAVRVQSWRQKHNDKRADPRGRVPGDAFRCDGTDDELVMAISDDDVYDFTRVVGNSRQRRKWHKTQLNEGLVERCIKLTTAPGEYVLDPFGGTGTTLRVCRRLERPCTLVEVDPGYCTHIAAEHEMAHPNRRRWEIG